MQFQFKVYWCHICLLNLYACRWTWRPIREAVKQSDLKNSHRASAPPTPKTWREEAKNWWKIHGLLIFVQTKVEDVDKIFDRVGICVTRETGEIIHIDFLTDTTFTYIGSCLGGGGAMSKRREDRLWLTKGADICNLMSQQLPFKLKILLL